MISASRACTPVTGYQTNGSSYLFGVDRTWKLFERNLNLNADLVQSRDQRGLITAVRRQV
jgi:hypothetical protein